MQERWIGVFPCPNTVTTFNSCTKCMGSLSIIDDGTSDCHPDFWAWMHGWGNNWIYFDLQASWVIDVFGLFLDALPMGVCTTRQWETSSRLVQALYVCTVAEIIYVGDTSSNCLLLIPWVHSARYGRKLIENFCLGCVMLWLLHFSSLFALLT